MPLKELPAHIFSYVRIVEICICLQKAEGKYTGKLVKIIKIVAFGKPTLS